MQTAPSVPNTQHTPRSNVSMNRLLSALPGRPCPFTSLRAGLAGDGEPLCATNFPTLSPRRCGTGIGTRVSAPWADVHGEPPSNPTGKPCALRIACSSASLDSHAMCRQESCNRCLIAAIRT